MVTLCLNEAWSNKKCNLVLSFIIGIFHVNNYGLSEQTCLKLPPNKEHNVILDSTQANIQKVNPQDNTHVKKISDKISDEVQCDKNNNLVSSKLALTVWSCCSKELFSSFMLRSLVSRDDIVSDVFIFSAWLFTKPTKIQNGRKWISNANY
jgi:hypothetical protein